MNKIEEGKKQLVGLGIIMLVLAILTLTGGLVCIIFGSIANPLKWALIVVGIVLLILFFIFLIIGISFAWTSTAMVATNGSIKEDNIAKANGTINIRKCNKCGSEVEDGKQFCGNCGTEYKPRKK